MGFWKTVGYDALSVGKSAVETAIPVATTGAAYLLDKNLTDQCGLIYGAATWVYNATAACPMVQEVLAWGTERGLETLLFGAAVFGGLAISRLVRNKWK